jgi:hypothetical protein
VGGGGGGGGDDDDRLVDTDRFFCVYDTVGSKSVSTEILALIIVFVVLM